MWRPNLKTMTITDYKEEVIRCVSELDNEVLDFVKNRLQQDYQYNKQAMWSKQIANVYLIGNGGSHAIAEHIATDLYKRCRIRAHTLSNNSLLTALTNDYSQEDALAHWLKMQKIRRSDYVIAISSSGKSSNIIKALEFAGEMECNTLSIFGFDGEAVLTSDRDKFIKIDSHNYGVVELTSEIALHAIVEELVVE